MDGLFVAVTGGQIGAAAGVVGAVLAATAALVRTFSDVQKDVGAARSDLTDTLREQVAALRSDQDDQERRFERALAEERERCDDELDKLEARLRAEFGVTA